MSVELFEETSAADLGHVLLIDRAQISRSVRDLMEQGFLLTRPDPSSKRRKLLRLSDEGQALLDIVKPAFARRQEDFIAALGETEAKVLNDAIATLTSYLAQELEHPGKADADPRS